MTRLFRSKAIITAILAVVMTVFGADQGWAAYGVKQSWARLAATAGETLAIGNVVCIKDSDGKAYKADANDAALRPAVGIIGKGGSSGDKVEIIVVGRLTGWSSLSEGTQGYLSETAGALTQSAPAWNQPLGIALSTTDYYFNFSNYYDTSAITALGVLTQPIVFEGATANDHETTLTVVDPTADNTITLPDASGTVALRTSEITTATDVLTAGECGKVIFLNSATEYQTTLPALSTVPGGCEFEFIVKAAASGANYTVITGNSKENKIYGSMEVAGAVVACADEDTITLVDGNAVGDRVKVISDGANWYISGSTVTTAKATCTQAD